MTNTLKSKSRDLGRGEINRPSYPNSQTLWVTKMMAQDGANRVGTICAIIFAVPRPLLQSPKGPNDGAEFPSHLVRKKLGPIPRLNLGIQKSRNCSIWGIRFGGPIPGANSLTGILVRNIPIFLRRMTVRKFASTFLTLWGLQKR